MSKNNKKGLNNFIFCFIACVVGIAGSFFGFTYLKLPLTDELLNTQDKFYSYNDYSKERINIEEFGPDLTVHFLELGNKYTGDCVLIQTKTHDILMDCGSKTSSISTISNYINKYVKDGILEYVIVTHAHQDHYSGFATSESMDSIFDLYECKTIIDFALTNQKETSRMYKNYLRERNDEINNGAVHYTARDCIEGTNGGKNIFEIGENISMKILNNKHYFEKATSENDYSVCTLITQNLGNGEERNLLFTGDLEAGGEKYLISEASGNNLPKVDLYKAGHHGSKTSSCKEFLEVIRPKIVCVTCCAGSPEYTDDKHKYNQFPTQTFVNNIAPYTTDVYVTSLCINYKENKFTSFNGDIIYLTNKTKDGIVCSNNNTPLKDSEWFKENRECPACWQNVA